MIATTMSISISQYEFVDKKTQQCTVKQQLTEEHPTGVKQATGNNDQIMLIPTTSPCRVV